MIKVGNAYVDAGGSAGNNADIKGANMLVQAIVSNHSLFRVESNEQSSFGLGQNNNLNKRNVNNSQPASSDIYIINNINIYLNNTIYTKLGTIILKPSYQKGLGWFNSKKDENYSSMLKTESRLQYDLIKFYAYYNTRLNLPLFTKTQVIDPETNQLVMVKKEIKNKKIKENKEIKNGKAPLCPSDISPQKGRDSIKQNNTGNSSLLCGEVPQSGGGVPDKHNNAINNNTETELIPLKVRNKINLNYTLTFDSQYIWNTLYGTDQFSVGSEYTVRCFRNENISGDNGYYIRNDLSMNLKQLFPKILINTKFMNYVSTIKGKNTRLSINDALSRIYLDIFYDYVKYGIN